MRFTTFALAFALLSVASPAMAEAPPIAVVPQSQMQVKLSYAPVVKATTPAVVNIYTKTVVRQRFLADPFFQQFLSGIIPPEGVTRERVQNSLGSGVLVRDDGLIVTADHVIKDADEVRVVLSDRREFPARIITRDERTDLAVLKIDAKGKLPALEIQDSDTLEVGDLVLAIGNPFGVGQTVTSGIVSALARTTVGINDYNFFIQTDAAINPGNSGGALVTVEGKLVGINSAIYSQSGGSQGIGFAIPSSMVRRIIEAGASGAAKVVRPWLGVDGQTMTAEIAASMGLERPAGVLVQRIHPSSPAGQAGLKRGDVIIAYNGRPIDDPEALRFRIASAKAGDNATLSVMHPDVKNGDPDTISFNLITAPESPPRQSTQLTTGPLAGLTLANISPAVVEELGLEADAEDGVVVTQVASRSAAAAIGFTLGDKLVAIGGEKVSSPAQAAAILAKVAPRQRLALTLERQGRTINIAIR